ncbi:MAG: 50S ribosomal protein L15 [Deltaproteobacteria bacterium]|nr:50S ribosomal protein L15 [Deltaproteobacteria bacterium]
MKLNELPRPLGRKQRKRKRLGRGESSGHGKTAGKGNKGQLARSGGSRRPGFEGGQMPLARRLPKRGFTNIFQRRFTIVNLDQLEALMDRKETTDEVFANLKILGRGDVTKALVVKAAKVSASARKKIEARGGRVEVVGG